jgi:hypothetical protein
MTMSALDYWRSGIPIPTHFPVDFGSGGLPAEESRMRTYIFDRQMNSLLTKLMFTRWFVFPWFGPDNFHDWAINSEFQIVRNQIHIGRLAMLGLWSMNGPVGHQVLCYGYDTDPVRLYLYDPNNPDEETELTPVSPAEGCRVRGVRTGRQSVYRGYFFTDVYNWDENPPLQPRYVDLAVSGGIDINPSGPDGTVGQPLQCSVSVRNTGEYTARFTNLFIWVRGPNGENLDGLLGGAEASVTVLQPGQEHLIQRASPAFGQDPGTYTIGASYLSEQGHWRNLPAASLGAQPVRQITLWRPKALVSEQWIDVREADMSDVPAFTLQPGDEFALTGTGTIWAGVAFTGVNGPEGWADWQAGNDKPLPGQPPFSLIARFDGEPYFYVGTGFPRRPYDRGGPLQLFLRINDDRPDNGSGQFRCLVQVWR